jgi:hypothetical protein
LLVLDCRFFASWKLKRRKISGVRTSNSSLSPSFASRFPTVLARPVPHSSQIGRVRSERLLAGDKRIFSVCCPEHGVSVIVIGHSHRYTMYGHPQCLCLENAKWLVHVVSTSDVREVGACYSRFLKRPRCRMFALRLARNILY